jgi:ribonuclease P protein component
MLPRKNRLQAEKDIEGVLKKKAGVFDEACGVRYAPNTLGLTRAAFSVGKKVSLLSVERNRLRRQYREMFMETLEGWPGGYDYVFLTAKPALKLKSAERKDRFYAVLRKVQTRLA